MRLTKDKNPSLNEYVLCKVIKYVELNGLTGAYCHLVHYDNIEALLIPSEAVRNRYQRVEKIHKLGNQIICQIFNIEGSHIDLSFKSVSEEEEKIHFERLNYVERIWRIIDWLNKNNQIELNKNNQIDDIFDLLFLSNDYHQMDLPNIKLSYENILMNPILLFENQDIINRESYVNELKKYIQIEPYTVSLDFNLMSLHSDGLTAIKKLLNDVFDKIINENNGRIELHSLPTYRIIFDAIDNDKINNLIKNINVLLNEKAKEYHCMVKTNEDYNIVHERKIILSL